MTGLIATAAESFACSDDPLYAAEKAEKARAAEQRLRQESEGRRQEEAQRQATQQVQRQQEAERQRLALTERQRADSQAMEQRMRELRAEQDRQSAIQAQQQAYYAQQQALQQQRQAQKLQQQQQREQAFNQGATGLMAWAARMDAKKQQEEDDQREETAARERQVADAKRMQLALAAEAERVRRAATDPSNPHPTTLYDSYWSIKYYSAKMQRVLESKYTFRADGTLEPEIRSHPGVSTWEVISGGVLLKINDGFAVYSGRLSNSGKMTGNARNSNGVVWEWEADRIEK